jgi:hypothetical protein
MRDIINAKKIEELIIERKLQYKEQKRSVNTLRQPLFLSFSFSLLMSKSVDRRDMSYTREPYEDKKLIQMGQDE